jgi:NADH:ubiquinone oxidoreductase subunit K
MGPGVGVVLLYSFYLFVRQIKFSIFHGKNHGRVLMLISIVFDFSCYGLIYFFQYIQKTPFQNDVFRLYYISSIVSSVLMAIGLHMMRVRMKELQSLKTTRKELALIFVH